MPSGWWQPWWIWLDANQRSATVRVLPMPDGLVGQLRPDQSHRDIGYRAPKRPPPHALFHRSQVEVFDHDLAEAARQLVVS